MPDADTLRLARLGSQSEFLSRNSVSAHKNAPLRYGRGSDRKSRSVNETIRATTVREWLLRRRTTVSRQKLASVVSTKWMDRRQQRESRLKGGCSQDWLPHNVSSYLLDTTLAIWLTRRTVPPAKWISIRG